MLPVVLRALDYKVIIGAAAFFPIAFSVIKIFAGYPVHLYMHRSLRQILGEVNEVVAVAEDLMAYRIESVAVVPALHGEIDARHKEADVVLRELPGNWMVRVEAYESGLSVHPSVSAVEAAEFIVR